MANTIGLNEKLTAALDTALVQKSVTGFLKDNALRAQFVGAGKVIIDDVEMQGLADYDRTTGFSSGTVTLTRTPYDLKMDRGRSFQIDAQDADESGIPDLMGKMMGEFVRNKVIPEMDAYNLSTLAKLAKNASQTVAGDIKANPVAVLMDGINKTAEATGYDDSQLVAFVNPTVWAAIQKSAELQRQLVVSDFKKGEINTKVHMLNGCAIIPVSDARMYDTFTFGADGFTHTGDKIGALFLPKSAACLVEKTVKVRNFRPEENQTADAWKSDYRAYWDVIVRKNQKKAIFVNTYAEV